MEHNMAGSRLVTDCFSTGLTLGMRPANGKRRDKVTPSHTGWAQT